MSGPSYRSWSAIAAAIKDVASRDAHGGRVDVNAVIASARFDRFLSRVFAGGEESQWLLKGGSSMLARVAHSRSTKDVDLASTSTTLDGAVEALQRAVRCDLGDHLTFELARTRATGRGDDQPGVETRRLIFTCRDVATRKKVGDVPVDIVIGGAPVGEVEVVEPANRLSLPRGLPTHPYRLYPLVDQVADKVCATMSTNYPGGKRSSRVKDLVDLVVIAGTQRLDLDQLRVAILTKRSLSGLESFDSFAIPEGWARTYSALAVRTPAAELTDVGQAEALVAQLVDRALAPGTDGPMVWIPRRGWAAPSSVVEVDDTPPR